MPELITRSLSVHDKKCLGCTKHNVSVMITVGTDELPDEYTDIFLTEMQAIELAKELSRVLIDNNSFNPTFPVSSFNAHVTEDYCIECNGPWTPDCKHH